MKKYFTFNLCVLLSSLIFLSNTQKANGANQIQEKRAISTEWNPMGPYDVGSRTRAIFIDPINPNRLFAGSTTGGLFKSEDNGMNWVSVNDYLDNSNITAVAVNSTGIIVYGTGEGHFLTPDGTLYGFPFRFSGNGIYKSLDSGKTFQNIIDSKGWGNVSSIAVNGKNFYVATENGIYTSENGLNWLRINVGIFKEIKVDINGNLFANGNTGIVKSSDKGISWKTIIKHQHSENRMSVGISPQDANYLYVLTIYGTIYQSKDNGESFTEIIDSDRVISTNDYLSSVNTLCIAVNPNDKEHVAFGFSRLFEWKKTKGITILDADSRPNKKYLPKPKHILIWQNNSLFIGTDFGIFQSNAELSAFESRNKGYNTFQMHSFAADYNENIVAGTTNGNYYISNKNAHSIDPSYDYIAFACDISIKDHSKIFTSKYYGYVNRSNDFGKTNSCFWDNRIIKSLMNIYNTDNLCDYRLYPSDNVSLKSNFTLWEHPSKEENKSRLFLFIDNEIWMAEGVTDFSKTPTWYLIAKLKNDNLLKLKKMVVTNDGASLFFIVDNKLSRIDGLNTAIYNPLSPELSIPSGISITNLISNLSDNRPINSIQLNPNNNNVAILTIGSLTGNNSRIFKGENMLDSSTFTDISSDIPNVPIYDGLITYYNENTMLVATEIGLYATDNGGASWINQSTKNNNLPKVPTVFLRQYYFPFKNQGVIYLGTSGRGIYQNKQYVSAIKETQKTTENDLKVYPQPATNGLKLDFNTPNNDVVNIKIVNIMGTVVFSKKEEPSAGPNSLELDVSNLNAGIYILVIEGNSFAKNKTIIISR